MPCVTPIWVSIRTKQMQNHIYERVRNLNTEYLMFLTIYCQLVGEGKIMVLWLFLIT